MNHTEWPPQFERVVRSHLPLLGEDQPVDRDLVLTDYGLDSLALVSLLLELEELFGTAMPDTALGDMSTADVGTLWDALRQQRLGGTEAGGVTVHGP